MALMKFEHDVFQSRLKTINLLKQAKVLTGPILTITNKFGIWCDPLACS